MEYRPHEIEKKWQTKWLESGYFEPKKDKSLPKKYVLSMFPYPSGRIHMGHVRNYTIGDAFARYYRQQGFNVLHPIGWDSFGMPAENAAIKHGIHPKKWTYENIDYMRKELQSLGLSFSQTREFATSDKEYTKFEQEFIIELWNRGLLYKKKANLNWCPNDKTVLANEQVVEGKCWRCGHDIEQKEMEQYYLKITAYADELLEDLKKLTNWPHQVRTMQENWIGKSRGLQFKFQLKQPIGEIANLSVFTTRPDTIYGVTYIAVAPEHKIIDEVLNSLEEEKRDRILEIRRTPPRDRATMEKEGIPLGIYAIHPLTGEKVEIWTANFVLADYGSGAVMAVPAHDERDFEFASKYGIEKRVVVVPENGEVPSDRPFIEDGILQNSGKFSGLSSSKAREKIIEEFEKRGIGKAVINYKLRDWGISRQRYWGAPIPLIHCSKCGTVPEKIENLPVTLPEDVEITGEGNPLDNHPTWKFCKCPKCGGDAVRETDTMDTFIQSSWYQFHYTAENPKKEAFGDVSYWTPIDHYIGGIEHAILHLLYARFFTKLLRDLGKIEIDEPFNHLLTQGMVLKDGAKMSKSKGNVIDPDEIISKYGADTARLFILFTAPPTKELEWNDSGVEGAFRFIRRLILKSENIDEIEELPKIDHSQLSKTEKFARRKVYEALKRADEVYNNSYTFNTLIAGVMEALNGLDKQSNRKIWSEGYWILLNILEPIIPHVAWELSEKFFKLRNFGKLEILDEVFEIEEIKLGLSINGKNRGEFSVPATASKDEIISIAKQQGSKWIEGKDIIKEIYVPNRLVNIVVK